MFHRHRLVWPEPGFDDIRRRSHILVIDDQDFPYQGLFQRDGYHLTKVNDVANLSELEDGNYDVILLDLQGVGTQESVEGGLGLLRHLRTARPAQIVIAYSAANFGLNYQPFFQLADAVLQKSADYLDFKERVDELLRSRFSLGFYINRITQESGLTGRDRDRLGQLANGAITANGRQALVKFLRNKVEDGTIDRIVKIVEVAIAVASLWK